MEVIKIEDYLSDTEKELYQSGQLAFENAIQEYFEEIAKPTRKVFDKVYFIEDDEIKEGVIREVDVKIKANGDEIIKDERYVIFVVDKRYVYPDDIKEIYDDLDEIAKSVN